MQEITLALAILLAVGFVVAKVGQHFRLPSVTGYICAGILLGPSGLNLVTAETIGTQLQHFTQIALMLIAFSIAEHLELKKLRRMAKNVVIIGLAETSGAFFFVCIGALLVSMGTHIGDDSWLVSDYIVLSILLAAISIATAPAATIHVMRELKAAGPLTTTLMAVVAVNNGLAIITFGIAVSFAHHVVGIESASLLGVGAAAFSEIVFSLLLGILTGILLDMILKKTKNHGEMLTVGLALLLLCGEIARLMEFSALLAGMAAGFTIINRDSRDVRLFRALNSFEPPIYVLFFTLAGTHLEFATLVHAGWLGLAYFLFRAVGKIVGAHLGARISAASQSVQKYLGLALIPQAGIAISLIILVQNDTELAAFSDIITPVILAGVLLSELLGPVCARIAVEKAGEAKKNDAEIYPENSLALMKELTDKDMHLVPWTWDKLQAAENPDGVVIFGAARSTTVACLARMATLLAHHYRARPLSLRIQDQKNNNNTIFSADHHQPFALEKAEARSLGYELQTALVNEESIADAILDQARLYKTHAIILGHPEKDTAQEFQRVVDAVARESFCQIIVVRLCGILHTEKILVPIINSEDLLTVRDVVAAMSGAGKHQLTLLRLMPGDAPSEELAAAGRKLEEWTAREKLTASVRYRVEATEDRLETILAEAKRHDFLVMAASHTMRLKRFFFGSLAEDVAQRTNKPMLMVYDPSKDKS